MKTVTKKDMYLNSYIAFKVEYEKYIRGELAVNELPGLGIIGYIYWTLLQYVDASGKRVWLSGFLESISEHFEDYFFDEWVGGKTRECNRRN